MLSSKPRGQNPARIIWDFQWLCARMSSLIVSSHVLWLPFTYPELQFRSHKRLIGRHIFALTSIKWKEGGISSTRQRFKSWLCPLFPVRLGKMLLIRVLSCQIFLDRTCARHYAGYLVISKAGNDPCSPEVHSPDSKTNSINYECGKHHKGNIQRAAKIYKGGYHRKTTLPLKFFL